MITPEEIADHDVTYAYWDSENCGFRTACLCGWVSELKNGGASAEEESMQHLRAVIEVPVNER